MLYHRYDSPIPESTGLAWHEASLSQLEELSVMDLISDLNLELKPFNELVPCYDIRLDVVQAEL